MDLAWQTRSNTWLFSWASFERRFSRSGPKSWTEIAHVKKQKAGPGFPEPAHFIEPPSIAMPSIAIRNIKEAVGVLGGNTPAADGTAQSGETVQQIDATPSADPGKRRKSGSP
jgi:hypothetical protein